jgi:adenylate cyclase class 2
MKSAKETEVKIRLADRPAILNRLRRAGFEPSVERLFESNTLYDTQDHNLRKRDMILRLRQVGKKGVITWKGRGDPGRHKSRPEIETTVGSIETLGQILAQLGYEPSFKYEKYRTEFVPKNHEGVATLDETPIGDFLELEGPGEWIDDTAKQLGFSQQDYLLDSYARLYVADCERRGVEPSNMVFASHGS